MKKFCIIVNKDRDERLELTEQVKEYLSAHGKTCEVRVESLENSEEFLPVPADTECVIVLGGDGTMIRAANRLKELSVPMLGINAGNLGYLTGAEVSETEKSLERLCSGAFFIEKRMMLDVEKDGNYSGTVLNEVAITRNGVSRLIDLKVSVNGALLDVISGDGLLISTPTGSTGYNMSAGGAIVKPEAELIMITPLCPHSLSSRPVIVTAEDEITIEVIQDKRTQDVEIAATYDGREAVQVKAGEILSIRKSKYVTELIKLDERSFFEVLRSKLGRIDR
ncbi:MAG: NAD(+)/NADH kinase [Lachnospiraceae bacterium]|nr:NAD(+)/NADH kinase [Lachnospiraceae bacterium]